MKTDAVEANISFYLLHAFFFLVKIWHLLYITHNATQSQIVCSEIWVCNDNEITLKSWGASLKLR